MWHIIIKAVDYSKRFFLSEMFFFPDMLGLYICPHKKWPCQKFQDVSDVLKRVTVEYIVDYIQHSAVNIQHSTPTAIHRSDKTRSVLQASSTVTS